MLNKKLMMVALAAVALSACGKNDFNGTYTGYETQSGSTGGMGMGYPTPVTLNLKQNDEYVTGTYTSQAQFQGGQSMTGQFSASAKSSDKLDNVQLIMTASGGQWNGGMPGNGMGSFFSGSLSSQDDGRRLTGTLNQMGGMQGGMTYGKTLMLNRNGD